MLDMNLSQTKSCKTFAQSAEVWSVVYFHFNGEHLELSQDLQEGYVFVDIYYIYTYIYIYIVVTAFYNVIFLNAVVLHASYLFHGFFGPKTTYV